MSKNINMSEVQEGWYHYNKWEVINVTKTGNNSLTYTLYNYYIWWQHLPIETRTTMTMTMNDETRNYFIDDGKHYIKPCAWLRSLENLETINIDGFTRVQNYNILKDPTTCVFEATVINKSMNNYCIINAGWNITPEETISYSKTFEGLIH